ncbi:MAG: transcriptional repressor LexA [Melioribacteraceae bacterium]|nr:transcriptional repressor LexA [Melioribacteraceae bacterium]
MSIELTKIQKDILDFIIEKRSNNSIPPTLSEISEQFGYKNRSTVQQHILALEKKGYLKKTPNKSRYLEPVLEDKIFVPRPVLGEVAAGNPLVIYPDSIDSVELPSFVKIAATSFLLRVKGDSLKDAYIFNGDLVIVNTAVPIKNGAFVVAVLDDTAVIKRYIKLGDEIELRSENKEFKTIKLNCNYEGLRLIGVAVGIYRIMDSN